MSFTVDQIYWLFSSFAQGICALAGLLLAAFAIVQSRMERLKEKDESLDELHESIQKKLYVRICIITLLSTIAILSSFLILGFNNSTTQVSASVVIIAFFVNILPIIFGMIFVLMMIDPQKYKSAARKMVQKEERLIISSHKQADVEEFLKMFIFLEKQLRQLFGAKIETLPADMRPTKLPSLRQVVEALHVQKILTQSQNLEILEILRFRNLIVHGEELTCDSTWINRISHILGQLNNLNMNNV